METNKVLDLVDGANAPQLDAAQQFLRFVPSFMENYRAAEAKLPYHINVVDELRAGENAHSRILTRLLQQKTPYGKYEILESLIRYIQGKRASFSAIRVENPEITQEKERIDLWVRDSGYSIIFENKVHGASDQSEQLSRYIDRTKDCGYDEKQIYVVYLSPTCDKQPDEQTWGGYREKFEDRFVNLSFKDDILRWLTDSVMPEVRVRDKYLSSAVEQYMDHLEGMFELRNINQKMNMELHEFIKQEWRLNDAPKKNVATLQAKQEEIKKINNQIDLLKNEFGKSIFQEWKTDLKSKYSAYKQEEAIEGVKLIIPFKDISLQVLASVYEGQLICQVDTFHLENAEFPQEVKEKTGRLLPAEDGPTGIWKSLQRDAYDETYKLLLQVIEIIEAIKQGHVKQ